MSKVDMSVFEAFASESGIKELNDLVYQLASNDLDMNFSGLTYPFSGGRDWKDPTYQAELEVYYTEFKRRKQELISKYGYIHHQQEGGGEGGAEYCYGVFELAGKAYKAEYSYMSHEGHSWDCILDTLHEVKPVLKQITVWE